MATYAGYVTAGVVAGVIVAGAAGAVTVPADLPGGFDAPALYRTRAYAPRATNGTAGSPTAVPANGPVTSHTLVLAPSTYAGYRQDLPIHAGVWVWIGDDRNVLPSIDAGTFSSEQTYTIHLWNNDVARIVTAIRLVGLDGTGVTTSGPAGGGLPLMVLAGGELQFTVTVPADGPVDVLAGTVEIDVDGGATGGGMTTVISLEGDRTVSFLYPPDWSKPVTVELAFYTDVVSSDEGGEQRRARRATAARSLGYQILTMGASELAQLRRRAVKCLGGPVLTALWTDGLSLTVAPALGDTVLATTATAGQRFAIGQNCIVFRDAETFAVTTVRGIGSHSLAIDPLAFGGSGFAVGDQVFPQFRAEPLGKTDGSLVTDRFGRVTVTLAEDLASPVVDLDAAAPSMYLGFPIFPLAVNWATSPTDSVVADLVVNAYGPGRREIFRRDSQERIRQVVEVISFDRDLEASLANFFEGRLGRCRAFWARDLVPLSTATAVAGSALTLKSIDYASWYGSAVGNCRKHLAIIDTAGVVNTRKITNVANNGDGTETYTLDADLALSVDQVAAVYLLLLVRFDIDTLQLEYVTNTKCRAKLSFLEVPLEVPA